MVRSQKMTTESALLFLPIKYSFSKKIHYTSDRYSKSKQSLFVVKGNVRVYIERMLMSTRYYSIAHAYESIFEIHSQFVLIL